MELHESGKYLRYSEASNRILELENRVKNQSDKIAELENQWISVGNGLPKTTMSVLVTNGRKVGELTYVKYADGTGKWVGDNKDITAWMLKPKLPEALKDQGE